MAQASQDLGKSLVVRKPSRGWAVAGLIVGVPLLLFGALAMLGFLTNPQAAGGGRNSGIVTALVILALGALPVVAAIRSFLGSAGKTITFHERGLVIRGSGDKKVVPYQDMDELIFSATRVYSHGSYRATHERLSVRAKSLGGKLLTVDHRHKETNVGRPTGYEVPTEIERASQHISAAMANRMTEPLRRGETISWTPLTRLSAKGIESTPAVWYNDLGRTMSNVLKPGSGGKVGEWYLIPWNQVKAVGIDKGVFRLWTKDQSKPRLAFPTNTSNFHPGYMIVARILKEGSNVLLAR